MTNKEYMINLVYNEGSKAYINDVDKDDNPYVGVSEVLAEAWEEGRWDMWYDS